MIFYKVTNSAYDYGYYIQKSNAEKRTKEANENIKRFILEGKSVDKREFYVQECETQD